MVGNESGLLRAGERWLVRGEDVETHCRQQIKLMLKGEVGNSYFPYVIQIPYSFHGWNSVSEAAGGGSRGDGIDRPHRSGS